MEGWRGRGDVEDVVIAVVHELLRDENVTVLLLLSCGLWGGFQDCLLQLSEADVAPVSVGVIWRCAGGWKLLVWGCLQARTGNTQRPWIILWRPISFPWFSNLILARTSGLDQNSSSPKKRRRGGGTEKTEKESEKKKENVQTPQPCSLHFLTPLDIDYI